ncbi:MAG: hypothetical protein RL885_25860 [Planctomycetota bacterium]
MQTGTATTSTVSLPPQTPAGWSVFAATFTVNSGLGKFQSISPPAGSTTQ